MHALKSLNFDSWCFGSDDARHDCCCCDQVVFSLYQLSRRSKASPASLQFYSYFKDLCSFLDIDCEILQLGWIFGVVSLFFQVASLLSLTKQDALETIGQENRDRTLSFPFVRCYDSLLILSRKKENRISPMRCAEAKKTFCPLLWILLIW